MKPKNKSLIVLFCVLLIGAMVFLFVINKPHRNAANEVGVLVSPSTLVQAFEKNEQEANKQYLNKAISIKGILKEAGKNQDGQPTALFESDDPMSGVFCTMRDKTDVLTPGKTITVKGFCAGYTTDVLLTDCVLSKE